MKNTPKTLTLSPKVPRSSGPQLATTKPAPAVSYFIDNTQAATKVTVVKKSRLRLTEAQAAAAQAEVPAAHTEAPATQLETPAAQTKTAAAQVEARAAQTKTAAAQVEAPAGKALVRKAGDSAAPAKVVVVKSRLPKAKPEPEPVAIASGGPTVSQTTDATALAAIDTSSYFLPTVKVPGRRGRKPSEFTPENDEVAALNAVERAELKAVSKLKDRKAKGALADALGPEASAADLERRRLQIKGLINMGKERGFLTYAEINDQLPENIIDPEAVEGIIATFNDMGIAVYERAPDADSLLLTDSVATVTSDDEVEAAAATALSTVDSDFGRTTDPVRMYMREMGAVALLTREGEIEIAKRIEGGLKDMIQAISACPTTIAEIVALSQKIAKDEIKVDEVVDGFVDLNESSTAPAAPTPAAAVAAGVDDEEEELEEEEGDANGGAAGFSSEQLAQLKRGALEKFATIATQFDKMRKTPDGYNSKAYIKAQEVISHELMGIRFTAKVVEKLCDTLRGQMEEVRQIERAVLALCVNKCGMPRAHFIKVFPGNETDLDWVDGEVSGATCRP
jgi:RNA polymerase primary sigma factor